MCKVDEIALPEGTKSEAIDQIISDHHLKHATIQVTAGTQKGDNYASIIYKIVVNGKDEITDEPKTLNLILKSAVNTGIFEKLISPGKLFRMEIYMYTDLLPAYKKLQNSFGISNVFDSYPKLYSSSVRVKDEYLIMDDKKSVGYVMTDRKKCLDFEHCQIIMKKLAVYHSISFAMKRYHPELYKTFEENTDDAFLDWVENEHFESQCLQVVDKAKGALDPIEDAIELEVFTKFSNDNGVCRTLKQFAKREHFQNDHTVIIHGDCWSNNILFKYDESKLIDACLVDWQVSRIASPVIDLSYFLYNCGSAELLDRHFDELIQIYHSTLSESLRQMNCDPEECFPFSKLEEHIQKYFRFGAAISIQIIHFFTSDVDEVPDLKEMETFEVNFTSRNSDLYNARVRGVIKHAVKKGFI